MAIMEKALVKFFFIFSILDTLDIIERPYDSHMPGTFFLISVFLRSLWYKYEKASLASAESRFYSNRDKSHPA